MDEEFRVAAEPIEVGILELGHARVCRAIAAKRALDDIDRRGWVGVKCNEAATFCSSVRPSHADRHHIYSERWCHGADGAKLGDPSRIAEIPKSSRSRHARRDLFEDSGYFAR